MTEPNAALPTRKPPSAVRIALRPGLVGGIVGAVLSGLINYVFIGVPSGAAQNAVNHAVSGLISGFTAGFFGLLGYRRKAAAAVENPREAPVRSGRVDGPETVDLP
ncbi:hypothetical protein [Streptomyces sp. YKOK-I1]